MTAEAGNHQRGPNVPTSDQAKIFSGVGSIENHVLTNTQEDQTRRLVPPAASGTHSFRNWNCLSSDVPRSRRDREPNSGGGGHF